jgi:GMP synthase-like glutamine amidotransferase
MSNTLLIIRNITHEGPGLLRELLNEYSLQAETCDLSLSETIPDPRDYAALAVLGGPQSANDETPSMRLLLQSIREALESGLPYLGVCLGMQALVKAAGGAVVRSPFKEVGFMEPDGEPYSVELTAAGMNDPLFRGLGNRFRVFQLHGETVELTEEMTLLAAGKPCRNQVVRVGRNAYGLQCHFEMTADMFTAWMEIDPDLKAMDRSLLISQFSAVRDEYERTGRLLMKNFLMTAGLVHPFE